MKYLLAFLLALSARGAALNMVGAQTQNEGFFAVPAPGPVTIDGDSSEWDLSGRIESFGDTSVRESYSVRTAAMWDRDALYLFFDWRDPTPATSRMNPAFDPGRGWIADATQLRFLAGDHVVWTTSWLYDRRVPSLTYDAMLADDLSSPQFTEQLALYREDGAADLGEGFASAYRIAEDGLGYTHELRIPWDKLFLTPGPGARLRMGMEFLWGRPTGDTFPEHRYADNMQPGALSREFFWTAKHAWGDLTLLDQPVAEPRRYVPDTPLPKGAIAVPVAVPDSAARLTVAIEDAEGRRVRALAGGLDPALLGGEPLRWDGLDDAGRPVPAGDYTIRTLWLERPLHGVYERCFYNPGTPPWGTADRTGAWAADHAELHRVARAGDGMVAWCGFAEGGAGAIGIGPDGRKRWGDTRGAEFADANSTHAFSVPIDWNAAGTQLLRVDARTGAFAPFPDLPMPLPLPRLLGPDAPPVTALAASDEAFVLATADGTVRVFDPSTAAPLATFADAAPTNAFPTALAGRVLWRAEGASLHGLDLGTGSRSRVALSGDAPPARPVALDIGPDGSFYVLDAGPDHQVKRYGADGAPLGAYGRRGGRPGVGRFEPDGLFAESDAAVDARGNVWVTEASRRPRRLSVWAPDGSFLRDYIGNAGYSASGTGLHDSDPARAFAEGNEIVFDTTPGSRAWRVDELMPVSDPALVGAPDGDPAPPIGDHAQFFTSDASGRPRDYLVSSGHWGAALVVLLRDEETRAWRPAAAIANIAEVQHLHGGDYGAQIMAKPRGQFAGCDGADLLLWTDRNGDGALQRAECEIVPALRPTPVGPGTRSENGAPALPAFGAKGWSRRVDPTDFSFYASGTANMPGTWRIAPVAFTGDGAPIFTRESWHPVPLDPEWTLVEAVPVPGDGTVLAFAARARRAPGEPEVWAMRFDATSGAVRWTYPSPYHGVHGSHDAPMAAPGLLIGCLKICGIVPGRGGAPDTFMVRGNLGEDYWLTTDGLFVSSFFRDGRLPTPALPATEDELARLPMEAFSGGSEHFCGWAGRQSDGVVRMSCGLSREAGMVVRIEGLDGVREGPRGALHLSGKDVARAAGERRARAGAADEAAPTVRVPRASGAADGSPVDWSAVPVAFELSRDGQVERAAVRLCWDAGALRLCADIRDPLSPWRNDAKDPTALFKAGDGFDVRLRPSADADPAAREGDVRFVVAPHAGGTAVLEMREVAPGAPADGRRTYSSPVSTVVFDHVAVRSDVLAAVAPTAEGVRLELTLPWRELGVEPDALEGLRMRGDFALLVSDRAGAATVARLHRFRRDTNLVSDLPAEARLAPETWGEIVLDGTAP